MGIQERKSREYQQREKVILEAAIALFKRDDWEDVTMEEIAIKAEIGKGTIYKHFKSKYELYASLAIHHGRELNVRLLKIDIAGGAIERIRALSGIFYYFNLDRIEYLRLSQFCERPQIIDGLESETRRQLDRNATEFQALLTAILQAGLDEGVFPDQPKEYMILSASSAMNGSLRLFLNKDMGIIDKESYLEYLVGFILRGWSANLDE